MLADLKFTNLGSFKFGLAKFCNRSPFDYCKAKTVRVLVKDAGEERWKDKETRLEAMVID